MTAFSDCALPKVVGRVILFRRATDRGVDRVGLSNLSLAVAGASCDEHPASQRAPPTPSE